MRYRVYLIDEFDRIKAAEAFTALNEAEAPEIRAGLVRATHDVFAAHELW